MSKPRVKFERIKAFLMKDEEFKGEYEKLKPRYELVSQIIAARFESGNYNPTLDSIIKLASCLDKEIHVELR